MINSVLFADIDWNTLLLSVLSGLGVVLTSIGAAAKFFLEHLSKQRMEQRAHESAMMDKVTIVAEKFDKTVRDLQQEARTESRQTVTTLLTVQKETVDAVSILSGEVKQLGTAISDLKVEVARKVDK